MLESHYVFFRLDGESADAAERLLRAAEAKTPLAKDQLKTCLDAIGFNNQSLQIHDYGNTALRTYNKVPELYRLPDYVQDQIPSHKTGKFYLYCPISYKGEFYTPKDAHKLSGDEEKRINQFFFGGGGWDDIYPVLSIKPAGAPFPSDFDRTNHSVIHMSSGHTNDDDKILRCFRAEGLTKKLIGYYKKREDDYHNAVKAVFDFVRRQEAAIINASTVKTVPSEECSIGMSLREDEYAMQEFCLSVRTKTGEPTPLKDNDFFVILGRNRDDHIIYPNNKTPQGQALKQLLNAIPIKPSFSQFEQLKDFSNHTPSTGPGLPVLKSFDSGDYLLYAVPKDYKGNFNPPGAVRVSMEEVMWEHYNQQDRNLGVTPPPKPQKLDNKPSISHPDSKGPDLP